MKTIYRILGKRGRITIPFAFRQHVGFQPDDVLSFTIQEDQTVLIKREKLCNSCTPEPESAESAGVTLLDFLDSLTVGTLEERVAMVDFLLDKGIIQGLQDRLREEETETYERADESCS